MKIVTRPNPNQVDPGIGSGDNIIKLTDDQLDLFIVLISYCRIGPSTYAQAALELATLFAAEYGNDVIDEAMSNIDVHVSVDDDNGDTIFESLDGYHPVIEV